LNWKKWTSRKKYLVDNFKCLLLEHTFANNLHWNGTNNKSSGNDTRSKPTLWLVPCMGPSYGNALHLRSCPSTLSSLVLGYILGAKELVSFLIKNLRGLWIWNRHETHSRKKTISNPWLELGHSKMEKRGMKIINNALFMSFA
jgi:hypothetical protein